MRHAEPPPSIAIGPRVRKSPYYDATRRCGVKSFTVYNHMYMPTGYTDPVDEYWRLVRDVTVWDVACERQVEITGPDASRFVQYLTPRNLSKCRVGQCKYVLLTAQDGGIVNDAILLRVAENQYWLSPGDGDVLLWAQGIAVGLGFDVEIGEPDVSPLQIQGPKSPQVAAELFGDLAYELGYFKLRQTELNGIPVVLSRTGWSGELGYEIFLRDGRFGNDLWEAVMEAGRPYNIGPIAPSTIRSIEGGILSYVSDITRDDNPFVLGFDRLVDLEQDADFIGKEALKRIRAEGVKRRLVSIVMDGSPLRGSNEAFWPVYAVNQTGVPGQTDELIGHISRCVYSPRLEKNIGFANVPISHAELGTRFLIATSSGEATATVVETPFVQPLKKIQRDGSEQSVAESVYISSAA